MKKYKIILCDCPWSYRDNKGNLPKLGGKTYPTMTLEEIKSLNVSAIADENSLLFFWATMPLLQEALSVISTWGFQYTTCAFNWVKLNPSVKSVLFFTIKDIYSGLGHWVNGNAELCLLGKRGHPKRYEKNVKQILFAPRSRHSAKPEEVRRRIVRVAGDLPRIELFAREKILGWDSVGFEIDGCDIRESLDKLIAQ